MSYLDKFPRFSDLLPDDIAVLERVLVVESFRPGYSFVREGDRVGATAAAMYIILDGEVQVQARAPQGGFGVRRTIRAGELFGHYALILEQSRTATCVATTSVTVARLDRRVFDELNRRTGGLPARFQFALARQLAADMRELRALLANVVATGDEGLIHGPSV
jgi:CRP-like cAMP-binding protein